jgi:hypothetical protein
MVHGALQLSLVQRYSLLAAACGALALWALFNLFRRLRRDRLVADTPLVRIRSAAQGYVKIAGRAAPAAAAPVAAPLSARACIWWNYDIAVEEKDSRGNTHWRSVDSAASVELFALCDGDATCLVGPVNAEITPTTHDVWYGTEPRPAGPPPPTKQLWHSGGYRYTERLLSPGDRLCVMGELRSHSEVGNLDAVVAEKLRQWKRDQQTLLARFVTNHDGQIDAAEWEAARDAARRETQQQSLAAPIGRTSVVTEPTNGEPFLIAPLDGVDLVQREQRFAALYFALGLLFVALCGWALHRVTGLAG